MSDYFGALIRASGLAGRIDPPLAANHGITEIEVQQDAPPARTSPVTQVPRTNTQRTEIMTTPPVATTTMPASAIREYSAPPRTEHTELASDRPLPASAPEPRGETSMAPGLPTAPVSASSPRPQETAPDPGQAMVQAALRWVAAGDQTASSTIAPDITPSPPKAPQALAADQPSPPARSIVSRPLVEPASPTAKLPELAMPTRAAPIRQMEAKEQALPPVRGTRRADSREETVEVTIGAIHLRVDAPPPQTVVQSPLPTPRSTADRPPPRSALSRRALRRI